MKRKRLKLMELTIATDVAARKALVADSLECFLLGKPACDILTCDKHILNGVIVRISFRRSPNDFTVISESSKRYRAEIVDANRYVRKMTVVVHVLSAIEKNFALNTSCLSVHECVAQNFSCHSWHPKLESRRHLLSRTGSKNDYCNVNKSVMFRN